MGISKRSSRDIYTGLIEIARIFGEFSVKAIAHQPRRFPLPIIVSARNKLLGAHGAFVIQGGLDRGHVAGRRDDWRIKARSFAPEHQACD
jgi:hypothetical protein